MPSMATTDVLPGIDAIVVVADIAANSMCSSIALILVIQLKVWHKVNG